MTGVITTERPDRPKPPAPESLGEVQLARRARIVDAAVEMMLHRDYERIQMKDVSAAADVALGTTYRYFASKEHLFSEAILAWSERFPTDDAPVGSGRNVDQLKAAYRHAIRAFERHPTVYGTMVALQASTDPIAWELFETFAARQDEAFARYLPRLSSPRREQVVTVMNAVLDQNLRGWTLRRRTIAEVYDAIDVAAELLLG